MQTSRYEIQEILDKQGSVLTYQALDTHANVPVLYYQYLTEPVDSATHIVSDNIPNILNVQYRSGMTHVVTVLPSERQYLKHRLDKTQLEPFLIGTAQALEDAYTFGVVHGDIRPKRMLFDKTTYFIEGYGVCWELLPSRYMPPEKYQSLAGDVYSWAKTVGSFVPFNVPRVIANLLKCCLEKKPQNRPLPETIVDELHAFFETVSKHPTLVDLDSDDEAEILTHTQERFIKAMDILKVANKTTPVKVLKSVSPQSEQPISNDLERRLEEEKLVQIQNRYIKAMDILKEANQ